MAALPFITGSIPHLNPSTMSKRYAVLAILHDEFTPAGSFYLSSPGQKLVFEDGVELNLPEPFDSEAEADTYIQNSDYPSDTLLTILPIYSV